MRSLAQYYGSSQQFSDWDLSPDPEKGAHAWFCKPGEEPLVGRSWDQGGESTTNLYFAK